jgi:hypothetical protein
MSDVDDETLDFQDMASELIAGFAEHDANGLAVLDSAGRAAQLQARQKLHDYIDELWQAAERRGLNPAMRAEWYAVAALRDLAFDLVEYASTAQRRAASEGCGPL